MHDSDRFLRVCRREAPFLDQLTDIRQAECFLRRVESPARDVVVVSGPVFRRGAEGDGAHVKCKEEGENFHDLGVNSMGESPRPASCERLHRELPSYVLRARGAVLYLRTKVEGEGLIEGEFEGAPGVRGGSRGQSSSFTLFYRETAEPIGRGAGGGPG
jgi:hypothetical protein